MLSFFHCEFYRYQILDKGCDLSVHTHCCTEIRPIHHAITKTEWCPYSSGLYFFLVFHVVAAMLSLYYLMINPQGLSEGANIRYCNIHNWLHNGNMDIMLLLV